MKLRNAKKGDILISTGLNMACQKTLTTIEVLSVNEEFAIIRSGGIEMIIRYEYDNKDYFRNTRKNRIELMTEIIKHNNLF